MTQIYLTFLDDKRTPKAIKLALGLLEVRSTGSGEDANLELLSRAYDQAMERINGQRHGLRDIAMKILAWIVCAKRRLTTLELRHALAIEDDEDELDEENLLETEDMLSVCAGLVTVEEENNVVRLVHYTTQEYFERTFVEWFPDAETYISSCCFKYMSFRTFEDGPCEILEDLEDRLHQNPLYHYVTSHWADHVRDSTILSDEAVPFGNMKAHVHAAWQAQKVERFLHELYRKTGEWRKFYPKEVTLLHLAALNGLEDLIIELCKDRKDAVNAMDSDQRSPLSYAAGNAKFRVAEILLEAGAEVTARNKDAFGMSPILYAARNGDFLTVEMLLNRGWDIESKYTSEDKIPVLPPDRWYRNSDGRKYGGRVSATQWHPLGAETVSGPFNHSLLALAARFRHAQLVAFLVRRGADVGTRDGKGLTPLMHAAGAKEDGTTRSLEIVEILIRAGADIAAKNQEGKTSLQIAVRENKVAFSELLLKNGADPDAVDKYGVTPLVDALRNDGQWADINIYSVLIKYGANLKSEQGWSKMPPLWYALKYARVEVLKILVDSGVDVTEMFADGQTSLTLAMCRHAFYDWEEMDVPEYLIECGAQIDNGTVFGRTPLMYATLSGLSKATEFCLEKGAVPNATDHFGNSALSFACRKGYINIVDALLAKGVRIDSRDFAGRTPLWFAVRYGHHSVARKLRDHAAREGLIMTDTEVPAEEIEIPRGLGIPCFTCALPLSSGTVFRCPVCMGGRVLICSDCFKLGGSCLNDSHKLTPQGHVHN